MPILPSFALLLAIATVSSARAEGADDLKFTASTGLSYDSNLFRLPAGANALALLGKASPTESIATASLGVNLNKAYSLQRVELAFNVTDYRYQKFDYLSFLATNYRAAWLWGLTPHLKGSLSTSREQTLNSFVDFQGFTVRNERVDLRSRFDLNYELDANWRLLGGLARARSQNDQQLVPQGSYRSTAADLGVGYFLQSGSSAGYAFTHAQGSYADPAGFTPGVFDEAYSQNDHALSLHWAVSRDSSADLRLGHRSSRHPSDPRRDFGGLIGAASISWTVSGKSALAAGWTRELGSFFTPTTTFSRSDNVFIGPVWQLSPKAVARAQWGHGWRSFGGASAGTAPSARRDVTRDVSVSLGWQPFNYLALNASVQSSRRTANVPGLDYRSTLFNVNAQFSY